MLSGLNYSVETYGIDPSAANSLTLLVCIVALLDNVYFFKEQKYYIKLTTIYFVLMLYFKTIYVFVSLS